jgi:hypothetical protein
MRRVMFAILLAVLLVLTMGLGAALAVPEKHPEAMILTLECEDGGSYEVLVAGGNVAFLNKTERLIGKVFTFELFVDGQSVFEEVHGGKGKRQGLQDRLTTCTTPIQFSEAELAEIREFLGLTGDEEITAVLTVETMKVPAKKF